MNMGACSCHLPTQFKEIHNEDEFGVTNSTTDSLENFAEAAENDSIQTAVFAKSK
jgi:hypothetical protein